MLDGRRPWLAALAFVAVGLLALPVSAAGLEVLSVSPRGPVTAEQAARIQILFNKAIVPLAAPELGDAPPEWLRVDPPILARWRWAGTAVLVAEPASTLPKATTYRLTIARGVRSVEGATLDSEFSFSFATERPEVALSIEPPEGVDIDELLRFWGKPTAIGGSAPIYILWNQPVDDGSVQEHLSVHITPAPFPQARDLLSKSEQARLEREDPEAFAAWERFSEASRGPAPHDARFTLEPDARHPHRLFRIRPLAPWPSASSLTVAVRPGVRSLEGPDASVETFQASLAAPLPFAPREVTGRGTPGSDAFDPEMVSLVFTSPVRWQDVAPFVRWRPVGDERWRTVPAHEGEWWWSRDDSSLALSPLGLEGGARTKCAWRRRRPTRTGAPSASRGVGAFARRTAARSSPSSSATVSSSRTVRTCSRSRAPM